MRACSTCSATVPHPAPSSSPRGLDVGPPASGDVPGSVVIGKVERGGSGVFMVRGLT